MSRSLTAAALGLVQLVNTVASANPSVTLNPNAKGLAFPHPWEATGWCSPDQQGSPDAMATYALQEASWQNHAFIGAVPNGGIKVVRIHDLLNLLTVSSAAHPLPASAYNFTLLDQLLDVLVHENGLHVGFEIMGNPRLSPSSRIGVYTSWLDPQQLVGWRTMATAIAARYVARYGLASVRRWRFEAWNEPDHNCSPLKKMKGNITCDQSGWLGYWDACADGIKSVSKELQWGGPGTGGGTMDGHGQWVLPALLEHLDAKFKATGSYDCDFIAWHNKGALPGEMSGSAAHRHRAASCNSLVDVNISSFIARSHRAIASALPLGNEEVDPLGGWNHVTEWHSDARYAGSIMRILAMHEDMIEQNSTLNVSWGYHANDNAFLNYGDAWFEQRTLVARFEMNLTNTVEVMRKPSINTMAMLSLLGDQRHAVTWSGGGGGGVQPATPYSAPYGAIATSRAADGEAAWMLWNNNGTFDCSSHCNITVDVTLPPLPAGAAVRMYRLDQMHGNPAALFDASDPETNPYPTAATLAAMRRASELPAMNVVLKLPSIGGSVLSVHLPQPSIVLLHVCETKTAAPLAPPAGLVLRTTTTPAQVFVKWTDVASRCVKTFELSYSATAAGAFARVNADDSIFSAFVHQQTAGTAAVGCYKLAWTDYWGQSSKASAAVCIKGGQGLPKQYFDESQSDENR